MPDNVIAAKPDAATLEYLLKRRSVSIKNLTVPGPDERQVETILRAAVRVPDHGKLFPWYFLVFSGDTRRQAGEILKNAWLTEEPDAAAAKLDLEGGRFLRAPLVIGVISRVREDKNPVWEQILSAGAACQNLCLAANALGFGTQWVTEWYAYNRFFLREIGLDERDHVAGFIYIGTPVEQPAERDRPDLARIVTEWSLGCPLNKGENYGHPGMGIPKAGFAF